MSRAQTVARSGFASPRPRGALFATIMMGFSLIIAACTQTVPPSVTSVAIDQADFSLSVGASEALTATVTVVGGASEEVTWSSSAEAVATVSASGEVTAVSAGVAEITATSDADATKFDTVTVTVIQGPAVLAVAIDQADFSLSVGASEALTATVTVVGGASEEVTWSSSAEAVATVSASGEVTAVSAGVAEITATSDADATKFDTVTVTVTTTPTPSITNLSAALALGSTVELAWEVADATSVEVVCFDGASERSIETLIGTAQATTIAIPDADCLTIRVIAGGEGTSTDSVQTTLTDVVVNGNDAGPGSLRSVVAAAAPGGIVGFAADVDVVTLSSKQLVSGVDAHMFLDKDVTISGPTTRVLIQSDPTLPADASGVAVLRSRVFNVTDGANVRLDGVEITGGTFIGNGAAIRNRGDLHLSNAVLQGNRAFYFGGAISNFGTLLIEGSELRDNGAFVTEDELNVPFLCIDDPDRTCEIGDPNYIEGPDVGGSGGAVYTDSVGAVTIRNSVIANNRAAYSGGGIYVATGTVVLENTDVQGNAASAVGLAYATTSYGGGVHNLGVFGMTNGEVSGNVSEQDGGGLSNGSYGTLDRPMELVGVVVSGNEAGVYGGGVVNYHSAAGGPENLVVDGGSIAGNTAGNTGDNRYDILVEVAPIALAPATFVVPEAYEQR